MKSASGKVIDLYKMVAFDMDGTIGNTYPAFFRSIQLAMKDSFGKECTIEEISHYLGINDLGIVKALAGDKWEKVFEDYVRYYDTITDPSPKLFEGMRECVLELKNKGIKLALITGKHPVTCNITLKKFGLEGAFDIIKTGAEDRNIKNESMSASVREMGMDKSDCCYIGDDLTDIYESEKAGIVCYSAAWSKTAEEVEELERENPGKVFYKPQEFIDFILAKLN